MKDPIELQGRPVEPDPPEPAREERDEGECDCCGFGPVRVRRYPRHGDREWPEWNLCHLCSHTATSAAVRRGTGDAATLVAVCYATNLAVAELRAAKRGERGPEP